MNQDVMRLLKFWKAITSLEQLSKDRKRILKFFGAPEDFIKDDNIAFLQMCSGKILRLDGKQAICLFVEKDGKSYNMTIQASPLLKEDIGEGDTFAYIIVRRGIDTRSLYRKLD